MAKSCDCDDYEDDWPPYYEHGSSYELSGPNERPKLRSVSHAAHAAMNATPSRPANPMGFHIPRVRR